MKLIWLGIAYLVLSLVIGENHPFTLMDMYKDFPSWATSFYMSDSMDKILPFQKFSNSSTDQISHQYHSITNNQNVNSNPNSESENDIFKKGKLMGELINRNQIVKDSFIRFRIHRVTYLLAGDSIITNDICIYEKAHE